MLVKVNNGSGNEDVSTPLQASPSSQVSPNDNEMSRRVLTSRVLDPPIRGRGCGRTVIKPELTLPLPISEVVRIGSTIFFNLSKL